MPDTCPTPLDDATLAATWRAAWAVPVRSAPAGLRAELMGAWSKPQRHDHDHDHYHYHYHYHYHDQRHLRHLRQGMTLWMRWRDISARPGEVAIALSFHDAVYGPKAPVPGSNELNSAAWAAWSLVRAGADSDTAQRVHDLVMATQHGLTQETAPAETASSPDARLLVDIDLSILGRPAERFERCDQDVRKEKAWVPGFRYQEARAQVLQRFLDRPRLYHGEHAVVPLEAQASINLAAALASTRRRHAQ